jgi:hypothetical protein
MIYSCNFINNGRATAQSITSLYLNPFVIHTSKRGKKEMSYSFINIIGCR